MKNTLLFLSYLLILIVSSFVNKCPVFQQSNGDLVLCRDFRTGTRLNRRCIPFSVDTQPQNPELSPTELDEYIKSGKQWCGTQGYPTSRKRWGICDFVQSSCFTRTSAPRRSPTFRPSKNPTIKPTTSSPTPPTTTTSPTPPTTLSPTPPTTLIPTTNSPTRPTTASPTRKCYKLFKAINFRCRWEYARNITCPQKGYRLATILNDKEQQDAEIQIAALNLGTIGPKPPFKNLLSGFWLNGIYNDQNQWKWKSGAPFDYTNWDYNNGEATTGQCLAMWSPWDNDQPEYSWHALDCDNAQYVLCEKINCRK